MADATKFEFPDGTSVVIRGVPGVGVDLWLFRPERAYLIDLRTETAKKFLVAYGAALAVAQSSPAPPAVREPLPLE